MNCSVTLRTRIHPTRLAGWCVALAMVSLSTHSVMAQPSNMPDGIVASGSSSVDVTPTALRLMMNVQAQGKDAKSALRSLTEHKTRVRKELGEMNANVDSIKFASTKVSSGDDGNPQQQQYMQMMRMMQAQNGGISLDTDSMPTIYTATASLKVEWPLPTKDPDALAMLPQGLKDQITERDFAGSKNKPKLDEETMEKMEEMEEMVQSEYGMMMDDDSGAGPRILFVGKLDKEQRSEAMKKAMKEAKESAELMASILDTKLGKLKSVWATETADSVDTYSSYMAYADYTMMETESSEEATATTADGLKVQVNIATVFAFE